MPVCPSCGKQVLVLCADDGLCKDCSDCCRQESTTTLGATKPR
ncbi:MAG: hypothetical protein AABY30_01320 [Candidatus Thermoplasmatota archaeon]